MSMAGLEAGKRGRLWWSLGMGVQLTASPGEGRNEGGGSGEQKNLMLTRIVDTRNIC